MSRRALLLATRNVLESNGFDSTVCGIQFGPMPPPMCGKKYVSIHPGEWRIEKSTGLYQSFGVSVTITLRCSYSPLDRMADTILIGTEDEDIERIAGRVIGLIHLSETLRDLANDRLPPDFAEFHTPLEVSRVGQITPQYGSWFSAQDNEAPCGMSLTIDFGGAGRAAWVPSEM